MSRRHSLIGASKPYLYKEEDAEFYYRQTSGGVIMNNSPLVGSIDRIKGQTIAWNQWLKEISSTNYTIPLDGKVTLYNGKLLFTGDGSGYYQALSIVSSKPQLIKDHKYFFGGVVSDNTLTTPMPFLGIGVAINKIKGFFYLRNNITGFTGTIFSPSDNFTMNIVGFAANTGDVVPSGETCAVSNIMLFDLTLIYGEGNEPTTPEQFEADYQRWFGKPLTYEPYDEGSLRNVQMEGIKSVGFNQWDEEWESGRLDTTTGLPLNDVRQIRAKNYIPVIGGGNYHCLFGGSGGTIYVLCYDANKNVIANPNISESAHKAVNATNIANITFTLTLNCRYVRFYLTASYGTTYNNDICINISDTNKNGTYKPYKSDTRNFDVTTLTGKLNGEGESVIIFPDGMKGVNDVKDEIYIEDGVTKAVKRVGRVDLGTQSYQKGLFGTYSFSVTGGVNSLIKTASGKIPCQLICSKYNRINYNSSSTKGISQGSNMKNIVIWDSSYIDADIDIFKSAMNGVYLDYELAEPQAFVLDTPLPIAYNCEAGGTEQILPEEIGTGIAPIMDIKYKAGNVAEKPWYGIKWSEDNGQMQRIASNMELHATLPIQSNMKRCMLLDNGSVYKYISDADPFLYEDGTSVKYDGTDGQVMVEIPAYWYTAYKETDENNITWNYLKLYPEGGGQRYSRKIYRGAFEMITDNSDDTVAKGCSVSMLDFTSMGTTKDTTSFVASNMEYLSAAASYRNWNYANVDATDVKNSLGKPTTNRNRATFRDIAARRGAGFSQEYWDSYNSLIRLYVVEYCNFNTQANINDSLTVEGFKQGGLDAGVTNANSTKWNNFNGHNPFVPCGVTVPLGNKSGAVSYAFTNDDFDDVSITYSIPSYRGIENPFGHIWKFIDGLNRKGKVENDVTTEMIYVCDTVSKFAENDADGYVLQSDTAPRASGYFGGVDWDAKGTFWPKLGGRTMYSDYFYNAYANNIWYTLYGGGNAYSGSSAGLFYLRASSGSGNAYAYFGSRLLYTK